MSIESTVENSLVFDRWFDGFFDDYLQWNPVNATFLGASRYDSELPDYVREADTDRIARTRDLIARLDRIPFDGLDETRIYDRALARAFLEIQLWETGSRFFQTGNPSHHTREALFSVVALFQRDTVSEDDRVDAAIARMQKLPRFLATARDRIDRAPLIWTERALRETEAAVVYFRDGIHLLAQEQWGIDATFVRQAEIAAGAFSEHAQWLRSVLAERRIPFRPAGTEIFDHYLHRGHFLPADQTTDWWFDYAHAELVETTRELRELAHAIDWKHSAQQQLAGLSRHHPAVSGYYGSFERFWIQRRQQAIATDLVSWPSNKIEFLPIPPSEHVLAQQMPYQRYRCAPPLTGHSVQRMLVPPCDVEMSTEEQESFLRRMHDTRIDLDFVVRQGGLGRFVQQNHAVQASSRIGRIAGVDCAAKRAMFCSGTLVDGWMSYATELLEEIGVLTDQQRLWEARHRVRIAARAVADIAIHSGEFTIERTARFLRDEAWMPASEALDEAVTHSMFPGTGVAALAGLAAIDELRRQLEDREGAGFSARVFHDRLLSYGAIPVTLIAASMLNAG